MNNKAFCRRFAACIILNHVTVLLNHISYTSHISPSSSLPPLSPSSTPGTTIPINPTRPTRPTRRATRPPHFPDLPHRPPPPRSAAATPSLPVPFSDDVGRLARPARVDDGLHEVDEQESAEEGAEDDAGDAAAVDARAGGWRLAGDEEMGSWERGLCGLDV